MNVEDIWFSDRRSMRVVRTILVPASAVFKGIVAVRNWLYDRQVLPVIASSVPVLSVGNISVGGTGKTPLTAYFVQRLRALGRVPAVVMRGYGDDEPDVHRMLNATTAVYTDVDRARGIRFAVNAHADIVVLDDGFQHRRAGRTVDVVLVSAERWRDHEYVLPSGSLREPTTALARATLVIVTHRVAIPSHVQAVVAQICATVPQIPVATVALRLDRLERADGAAPSQSLEVLRGAQILAVSGVGDPQSFFQQLEAAGAVVTRVAVPDHYEYTAEDVTAILAKGTGHKYVVSTLKDVVKLRRLWPPKAPALWYVSQAVEVSSGLELIDTTIDQLLRS